MASQAIVVGVDRSVASRSALRWASQRAVDRESALILAHIVDDEWGVSATDRMEAEARLDAARRETLAVHPGLEVSVVCALGNPTVELLDIADRHALLVVGTHKTGFVQGRAFGSRSFRLAAAAPVPVAVIPERTIGTRHGVVVGIDDTEAGHAAIRFAATEAERTGEDLVLLLATGPGDRRSQASLDREMDLSAIALRIAEHTGTDLGMRIRAVRRAPSAALVDASSTATLLVVGSSRRHTAHAVSLGPVAHDVLFNITTPTIVVHPSIDQEFAPSRIDGAGCIA